MQAVAQGTPLSIETGKTAKTVSTIFRRIQMNTATNYNTTFDAMNAWLEHHRCERETEAGRYRRIDCEYGSEKDMCLVIGYQDSSKSVRVQDFETILKRDFANDCWREVEKQSADWDFLSNKLRESVGL